MLLRNATTADFEFVAEHSAFKNYYTKEPERLFYSVALEQDGNVIAVGGLMLITKHTAWAWCEITTFVENHKIELVRTMRDWLDVTVSELQLSRLQAWVDPERPEAVKLIKHLGFVEEFSMKDFLGLDKNVSLFIKLTGV